MEKKNDTTRRRADAAFKKDQQAREGAKARQEYEIAGVETRKKTERLRALRLAREASIQNDKKK